MASLEANMEEWKLGYAAGLLDGEGCITVNARDNQPRQRNMCYRVQVRVVNTSVHIIHFLLSNFGGKVNERVPLKGKRFYTWGVCGVDAVVFMRLVEPYVQYKKDKLKLASQIYNETSGGIKASLYNDWKVLTNGGAT